MSPLPEAFSQHLEAQGRAARTIAGYAHDLSLFARWFEQTNGEALTSATLTPTDARNYRQYLLREKAAPATINRHLAALRAYANWAQQSGQAEGNPLGPIHGVAEQPRTPHWLERQAQHRLQRELEKAQAAARTPTAKLKAARDAALVTVLLHTGLRVSELCALTWTDVTLSDRRGLLIVQHGKGEKRREVPLNADVRRALQAWKTSTNAEPNARVFRGRLGEALTPSGVSRMLTAYGQRAKVAVTPHQLRHTFAKNLVDAGVPLDQVATLLGHEKLETTRLYTLPGARDLEKAVARLED